MSTILSAQVALDVDARDMACPMPLLKAKQGLNKVKAGEKVRVRVTDPASKRDFYAYAKLSEHKIDDFEHQDSQLIYILIKGNPAHD